MPLARLAWRRRWRWIAASRRSRLEIGLRKNWRPLDRAKTPDCWTERLNRRIKLPADSFSSRRLTIIMTGIILKAYRPKIQPRRHKDYLLGALLVVFDAFRDQAC